MSRFRCVPVETETADRFRHTGRDDDANIVRRIIATAPAGFPCRHCLKMATPGEVLLLGSYNLPRPQGIYWAPSPIFVHQHACRREEAQGEVAEIVRANALVSIRAFDDADQCLYELGQVCSGSAVEEPLAAALADPRTAFINIHTARPGCFLCRVERLPDWYWRFDRLRRRF